MEATSDLLGVGDAFEDGMKTVTTKEYKPSESALQQSNLSRIIMYSMDVWKRVYKHPLQETHSIRDEAEFWQSRNTRQTF